MHNQDNASIQHPRLGDARLVKRGKVRDVYEIGGFLLIVATDRISCFDVVLPTPIPGKGCILTKMSRFWFDKTAHIIANHCCAADAGLEFQGTAQFPDLRDRSMLVMKAEPLPIEAVVRGYLAGSAWGEYRRHATVCGIELPKGLMESERLPEPIFTPATKAPEGFHDENISYGQMEGIIGETLAAQVRRTSLDLYAAAAAHASSRGLILADTKFEFGLVDGRLTLIDEVFTPDSSRFWLKETYQVGSPPPSFDKQFVRDYLVETGWDKEPPAPELPADVVKKTVEKYEEALRLITS